MVSTDIPGIPKPSRITLCNHSLVYSYVDFIRISSNNSSILDLRPLTKRVTKTCESSDGGSPSGNQHLSPSKLWYELRNGKNPNLSISQDWAFARPIPLPLYKPSCSIYCLCTHLEPLTNSLQMTWFNYYQHTIRGWCGWFWFQFEPSSSDLISQLSSHPLLVQILDERVDFWMSLGLREPPPFFTASRVRLGRP